ncbi:Type I Iterative PKS [Bacidia gigantensis]|uniref:Type I Iterative PKS n=1 Tax=Bacidia gigantensis TaxID=2732470 RepID=UPI001D0558DA|nr:Type I Iterative PKS [Bacidia gigantensis]KAG8527707.1 Type I Iterative PKS [Bacidia gigantensis]
MGSTQPTVLLFGDVTDPWVDGMDYVCRQATTTPYLKAFLEDLFSAFKAEVRGMDRFLRESFGSCSNFQELAQKHRHSGDKVGMVHGMLLYTVRAALLLKTADREPLLLNPGEGTESHLVGISAGIFNAVAAAASANFGTLYSACIEAGRAYARLCDVTLIRSRAIEDRPGVWGWVIIDVAVNKLEKILEQFQNAKGVPISKRVKVAITGFRWCSIVGPPSVLDLVLSQCPELKNAMKNELPGIRAMQHGLEVSDADVDYVAGDSSLHSIAPRPGYKVWGIAGNKTNATYSSWGQLLKAAALSTLSQRLDIVQAVNKLSAHLGMSKQADIKMMGPSGHAEYVINSLKAGVGMGTRQISVDDDLAAPSSSKGVREGAIAIVGMAGKGPSSEDLDEFWKVIETGQDTSQEVPSDRFSLDEYYCETHGAARSPGEVKCTMSCRHGCFIKNPGHFDAKFFHISPREALLMDPVARLFLMSAYEALERAGYSAGQTRTTDPNKIAVFFGASADDWYKVSHSSLGCDAYTLQGMQRAFGPGRLAFNMNWEGPTYSLDSACAGTTSAMHLASMSLLSKDIDMAVAGATNVLSDPHSFTLLSKAGVLSNTGNCKTYRDDADGYCRADFSGAVVLKRLEDAIAHNDQILAVIAASARNHSGNSTSITTSDANAQQRLFSKTLRNARLSPQNISYVEMHGTGTQVGDKAEMAAVSNVFSPRPAGHPLIVGGIKANIGHSEAGGNACVILEEYKQDPARHSGDDPRSTHVISSSARTQSSYLANLRQLAKWLHANPNARIQDVAYSTTARRVQHPLRFAFAASTSQKAISELEAEIERAAGGSKAAKSTSTDVVFVFTGQGSHYAGMGAELYRTSDVFRRTVDLCVAICASSKFPPFLDIITDSSIDLATKDAAQIQLAVITLEIALTAFWRSTGIVPAMVMGHSLGEYAALHAAGVLSLVDTLHLVGSRARLLLERCEPNSCAMLSVSASASSVRDRLAQRKDSSCSVACINSPSATVISGTAEDLKQIEADIKAQDSKTRTTTLSNPFAFHSSQIDAILHDYKTVASGVTYLPPKVPVASTLLASVVEGPGVFSEDYLVKQTRQPVDFCGGLDAVKSTLKNSFWLEIGPGPVCNSFVRATLSPPPTKINHSIDANSSNWASISKSLAMAHMSGADVDWLALHAPYEGNLELLPLPTYVWDVKDYWITHTDKKAGLVVDATQAAAPSEPFLGTTAQYLVEKTLSPKIQVTFRATISEHGFLGLIDGHQMQKIALASGSVFSDAAATVAKYTLEYSGRKDVTAAHLTFHDPELLAPLTRDLVGLDGALLSTATMESSSTDTILVTFKATSKRGESHDLGSIRVGYRNPEKARTDLDRVSFFINAKIEERIRLSKEGSGHRMQPSVFYALFANAVEFSPDFQGVQEAYVADDFQEAAATIVLPPDPVGTSFTSSPYWGEGLLHLAGFMVNGNPSKSPDSTFAVMGYDFVEQLAAVEPGKQYITYTRISRWEKDTAFCAAYVFNPQTSKIVMQAVDLRYQEFKTATWRHILGGKHGGGPQHQAATPRPQKPAAKDIKISDDPTAPVDVAPVEQETSKAQSSDAAQDAGVFQVIVDSLATATGSDASEFTDDTLISDIGVDSIMAIEVVGVLKELDVELSAAFLFEYPTIGDLRHEFGGQAAKAPQDEINATPSSSATASTSTTPFTSVTPSTSVAPSTSATPYISRKTSREDVPKSDESVSSETSSLVHVEKETSAPGPEADIDHSPLPKVRITLLQGRAKTDKTPLYIIADGTGTVASFIHFRPFKSKQTVFGIDSPYYRCPSRLTSKVGIKGVAKLIVDELIKRHDKGPFQVGGYSAGALVAYEVSRQLRTAGRDVDGLLLIDLCCPRSQRKDQQTLLAEDQFSYDVFEQAVNKDGLWSSIGDSREHFQAFFVVMNEYTPAPMTAADRPAKTAVVWAEKGLVNRVSDNPELMEKLVREENVPTKSYPGFMQDPKLGTFACLVPDKGDNLGPNGWDKFTGGEVMAMSVPGDHFDLPMPGHVHLLQENMEKAFTYFGSK